ncbi:MAG TPA: HWE histidine kinase domain-containing protein [Acidisoma sp.]|uniref:sensor histidine kinase n=1 Tax=Acidisoma sp. TaxID=1872115 RepID=UPI002B969E37|nr:HWE histidine kinase domain-containing protein [Acidisoma sp.]HTH99365.1 HWE histidine kinase domain-containing protein [Acidisoma sp.]
MATDGRATGKRDWFDYLPRRIRSIWKGQVLALVCLLVGFALRWALTPLLHYNGPFFTFFPAVLIAAVWGGPLAGFTTLAGGALLAAFFWLAPLFNFDVAEGLLPHLLGFLLVGGVVLVVAAVLRTLVERQHAAEERALLLAQEMRHRVRNLMGLVIAISHQTGRQARGLDDFLEQFGGRMEALSAALALEPEAATDTQAMDLDGLIARVLAPFGHDRCSLAGPVLPVAPPAASALALVLHELATNAVKYGALSVPEGRVEIGWRLTESRTEIEWREIGGPPVSEPSSRGFGSRLIQSAFARSQGEARIVYASSGVQCLIRF